MNDARTGLGVMAPALLNPGAAAIIAVGLVGYGLIKLFSEDEEEENRTEANSSINPEKRTPTVVPTVDKPLEQPFVVSKTPLKPLPETVEEPFDIVQQETEMPQGADFAHQDVIRQYMSELGKRSAAARARKRASETQTLLE